MRSAEDFSIGAVHVQVQSDLTVADVAGLERDAAQARAQADAQESIARLEWTVKACSLCPFFAY
jgi:hypothetical protein